MVYLSIALTLLGGMALLGFRWHLDRERGAVLTSFAALRSEVASLGSKADSAAQAANTTAQSAKKAIDDLTQRLRSVELKAGVRGFPARGKDESPEAVIS